MLVWVLTGIVGWIAFGALLMRGLVLWERRRKPNWVADEEAQFMVLMLVVLWPLLLLVGLGALLHAFILHGVRREP